MRMRPLYRSSVAFLLLCLPVPPVYGQNPDTTPNGRWSGGLQLQWHATSTGLDEAMRAAGFDRRDPNGGIFSFRKSRSYPYVEGAGGGFQVTVRWRPVRGIVVSALGDSRSSLGATEGFRLEDHFLRIDARSQMWAALVGIESSNRARLAVGPALFPTSIVVTTREGVPNTLGGSEMVRLDEVDDAVIGVVAEAGVELPPRSRFFIDAAVQYRWAPKVSIGPWDVPSGPFDFDGPVAFSATEVSLSRFTFSVGVGIR